MFRNVVINGGFNVNQRVASSNMTAMCTTAVTTPTQSAYFVADRWIAYRTGLVANGQMALMTLSNTDLPFTSVGLTNFARIGRSSGDTSVANINLVTNLESINSIPMAGKTVTLSFYARAGTNYSGSTNGVFTLANGVLTDQNYVNNGLGAGAMTGAYSVPFTATTSWQRFSVQEIIPATTTQIAPLIYYTPSGTAGAADYLDVTGVQLEIASSPTSFELRPFAVELSLCQRYCYVLKTAGPGNAYSRISHGVAANTNTSLQTAYLPVTMRSPSTMSMVYSAIADFGLYNGTWLTSLSLLQLSSITTDNGPNAISIQVNQTDIATGGYYMLFAYNSPNSYMHVSCEL